MDEFIVIDLSISDELEFSVSFLVSSMMVILSGTAIGWLVGGSDIYSRLAVPLSLT